MTGRTRLLLTSAHGRIAMIFLGVVLVSVVAVVILKNNVGTQSGSSCDPSTPTTAVRGVIGSEKVAYFEDRDVVARFCRAGFTISIDKDGSRNMLDAIQKDRDGYTFAFPSSTPTAEKIKTTLGVHEQFVPFTSPMVIATHQPIVDALTGAGVVQKASDGSQVLDIAALLPVLMKDTLWSDLDSALPKLTVQLKSTDPDDSNSAIMLLSIASQVANGGVVVATNDQQQKVLPTLCKLMSNQGSKLGTSQYLYEDYLTKGMGTVPMALLYESQFLDTSRPERKLPDGAVKMFPRPTTYSRHTLVPLDAAGHGREIGRLLLKDPELKKLAARHGFRVEEPQADLEQTTLPKPIDVVDPPTFARLEPMLAEVSRLTKLGNGCAG
ncbi:hypothetical protein [Umezawaea sp. NPDC059074]|uniref:hypothetical protein n=1 Tax=Umezawaea sp. NPDC059074 TaxID=3346716 RepID=UPI0036BDD502